jgi:uncharacterized membrane protein
MSPHMRYRLEVIAAAVTGLAAVLTAIVPDWIEEVFHIDPDGGNGAVEWLIVAALALATIALGALAWRERRRFA